MWCQGDLYFFPGTVVKKISHIQLKKPLFFFTFGHSNHPNFLKKSHNSGPIPVLRKCTHIYYYMYIQLLLLHKSTPYIIYSSYFYTGLQCSKAWLSKFPPSFFTFVCRSGSWLLLEPLGGHPVIGRPGLLHPLVSRFNQTFMGFFGFTNSHYYSCTGFTW